MPNQTSKLAECRAEIMARMQRGDGYEAIAKDHGCNTSTLWKWVKKWAFEDGVELPRKTRVPNGTRGPKAKYRVLVWQPRLRRYAPVGGVKLGPLSQFGVRKAIRELARKGHTIKGHNVIVQRIDDEVEAGGRTGHHRGTMPRPDWD